MKKGFVAFLCVALLCSCLLPLATSATENYYFIAFNDTLTESLTVQNTPIRINGDTYIPVNIFDSQETGGQILNIFSAQSSEQGTVTIYNKYDSLIFDLNAGNAYGQSTGQVYQYQAVSRNGLVYVPLGQVSRYFGLTCSYLTTSYGPLVRVKDGNVQIKSDTMFLNSVSQLLEDRLKGAAATNPTPPPSNHGGNNNTPEEAEKTPTEVETPAGAEVGTGQDVYLSILVTDGGNLSSLLHVLRQYQLKALFFFQVESLAQQDDLIRQVVGEGHQVGLIPQGTTAKEQEEYLAQGNAMLEHIIRQKSWFVLPGDDAEVQEVLLEKGWICWSANVTEYSGERSASSLYEAVISQIENRTTGTRLMLDDGVPSGTLSGILRKLQENHSVFHNIRETDY